MERPSQSIWYSNPFKFADIEDILPDRTSALAFFQDLLINRPTEFQALLNLYFKACRNLDPLIRLTRRQQEVVRLANEAAQRGLQPTHYAASKLKISVRAVQRLLKRIEDHFAEAENMFASGDFLPVDSNKRNNLPSWQPTERQIRVQMAAMPRQCAGCGDDTSGRFTLCYECGERYGFIREEWSTSKRPNEPAPANWLLPEARRIDREHRRAAINELYRAYSLDEEIDERILLKVS